VEKSTVDNDFPGREALMQVNARRCFQDLVNGRIFSGLP
jgi:hypothetical protein